MRLLGIVLCLGMSCGAQSLGGGVQMNGGVSVGVKGIAEGNPPGNPSGSLNYTSTILQETSNNTPACTGAGVPSAGCSGAVLKLTDHCSQSSPSTCDTATHPFIFPGPPTTAAATNTHTRTTTIASKNINLSNLRSLLPPTGGKLPSSHHVIVVMEENAGYLESRAQMPLLVARANTYAYATNYTSNYGGSLRDYLAIASGSSEGCGGSSCPSAITSNNVFRILDNAGVSWKNYADGLDVAGDISYPDSTTTHFYKRHNPAPWYSDVINNVNGDKFKYVPFTQFTSDLASCQLPALSYVMPNGLHDAHDGTLGAADTWLDQNVTAPLLASTCGYSDWVLLVTFDECGSGTNNPCDNNELPTGHVFTAVVGPTARRTLSSNTAYSHFSLLHTVLESLGQTVFPGGSATDVSMTSLFTLTGTSTVKVACFYQPWFGASNHISIKMDESNPDTISHQAQNMIARGCDYVVADWYGQGNTFVDFVTKAWRNYLDTCNCPLKLALVEDIGTASGGTLTGMENDISYMYTNYMTGHSSAWLVTDKSGCSNRPVLFFFGWGTTFSFSTIKTWIHNTLSGRGVTCNTEPVLLTEGQAGLSGASQNLDGAYNWTGVNAYDNLNSGTLTLKGISGTGQFDPHFLGGTFATDSWYSTANTTQGSWLLAIGSTYVGFNDTNANWGFGSPHTQGRKNDQQCGQIWVNSWQRIPSGSPVNTMGVVTWNDEEEGTGIENGIDNCYNPPSEFLNGTNLTIATNPTDATYSSLITVQDIQLWVSQDGKDLAPLITLPALDSQVVDLSTIPSLVVGQTYTIYVQQHGKPSITNQLNLTGVNYTR